MQVLALREFEKIRCGDFFDPALKIVSESQRNELEKFSLQFREKYGASVFEFGSNGSLIAQNIVGVIALGRFQIEILPKIEGDVFRVRSNLARMIAESFGVNVFDNGFAEVDRNSGTILEVIVNLFCQKLWQCLQRGVVRRYELKNENLSVLRGRLSVQLQIRQNFARPDRLACVFDEFTENTMLNQVLKLALRVLSKVVRSSRSERGLLELLSHFQSIDDISLGAVNWEKAKSDRLSDRYKSVLMMARLFIDGVSPDVFTGRVGGFSLLFDMNLLFEKYIGAAAKRLFERSGSRVYLQGPLRHLARTETGRPVFELRPDIVMVSSVGVTSLIDTKWKRLNEGIYREGVASSDIYQMYAYSTQYGAHEVVLLYPHHLSLGACVPRRAQYRLNGSNGSNQLNSNVIISTIDLRDLDSVPGQLKKIINPTVLLPLL